MYTCFMKTDGEKTLLKRLQYLFVVVKMTRYVR